METAPPGWKDDELSKFLADAHANTVASFANFPLDFQRLKDIDDGFRKLLDSSTNVGERPKLDSIPFWFRAHACFRAATRLALAGESYETAAVCRAGLEVALYGLHVARTPFAGEIWADRSKAPKRMKAEFTSRRVLDNLKSLDGSWGSSVEKLYEVLIDLGAHPNPTGIFGSLQIERRPGGAVVRSMYLWNDSPQLRLGIRITAQTGLACLGIACRLFPTRAEIIGLLDELPRLSEGL